MVRVTRHKATRWVRGSTVVHRPAGARVTTMTIIRSSRSVRLKAAVAITAASAGLVLAAAPAQARPVPTQPGTSSVPAFVGHPATAKPVALSAAPQNPWMAANPYNNIHNDASMTDSYAQSGPLGRKPTVTSATARGECASITFNSKGQIVAVCIRTSSYITLMDAKTLKVLVQTKMPQPDSSETSGGDYTDVAGGYFYLDNLDRPVVTTATMHLITYELQGSKFVPVEDIDLTSAVGSNDSIQSALPDYSGNKWFITKAGVVGFVDKATGQLRTTTLNGERIGNSFSMGADGGIYIVSTAALYRFDIVDGQPAVTWREAYANTGVQKPGQVSTGSGTTPTIMDGGYVAIADNGDPESVVVYHTAKQASGTQQLCSVPVFEKGASATENSLVAVGNSLMMENNYGYTSYKYTTQGRTTVPGLVRVDISPDGNCKTVWTNTEISAPTVVAKFSAKAGLLYTYSKPKGPGKHDPWYWTAVDYRTGKTVYKALVGAGLEYNNNYAALYVGPDGAGYVGIQGGIARIADSR